MFSSQKTMAKDDKEKCYYIRKGALNQGSRYHTPQTTAKQRRIPQFERKKDCDQDTFCLSRQYTTLLHQTRMNTEFVRDRASDLDHI